MCVSARAKAGERTSELGGACHNLAIRLRNAGQNDRAEQPARHALAIWEEAHGRNSGAAANACNTLEMILDQLRKDAVHYLSIQYERTPSIWHCSDRPKISSRESVYGMRMQRNRSCQRTSEIMARSLSAIVAFGAGHVSNRRTYRPG